MNRIFEARYTVNFFYSVDFSEAGVKAVIKLIYLTLHCYR